MGQTQLPPDAGYEEISSSSDDNDDGYLEIVDGPNPAPPDAGYEEISSSSDDNDDGYLEIVDGPNPVPPDAGYEEISSSSDDNDDGYLEIVDGPNPVPPDAGYEEISGSSDDNDDGPNPVPPDAGYEEISGSSDDNDDGPNPVPPDAGYEEISGSSDDNDGGYLEIVDDDTNIDGGSAGDGYGVIRPLPAGPIRGGRHGVIDDIYDTVRPVPPDTGDGYGVIRPLPAGPIRGGRHGLIDDIYDTVRPVPVSGGAERNPVYDPLSPVGSGGSGKNPVYDPLSPIGSNAPTGNIDPEYLDLNQFVDSGPQNYDDESDYGVVDPVSGGAGDGYGVIRPLPAGPIRGGRHGVIDDIYDTVNSAGAARNPVYDPLSPIGNKGTGGKPFTGISGYNILPPDMDAPARNIDPEYLDLNQFVNSGPQNYDDESDYGVVDPVSGGAGVNPVYDPLSPIGSNTPTGNVDPEYLDLNQFVNSGPQNYDDESDYGVVDPVSGGAAANPVYDPLSPIGSNAPTGNIDPEYLDLNQFVDSGPQNYDDESDYGVVDPVYDDVDPNFIDPVYDDVDPNFIDPVYDDVDPNFIDPGTYDDPVINRAKKVKEEKKRKIKESRKRQEKIKKELEGKKSPKKEVTSSRARKLIEEKKRKIKESRKRQEKIKKELEGKKTPSDEKMKVIQFFKKIEKARTVKTIKKLGEKLETLDIPEKDYKRLRRMLIEQEEMILDESQGFKD